MPLISTTVWTTIPMAAARGCNAGGTGIPVLSCPGRKNRKAAKSRISAPQGQTFHQKMAEEFAQEEELVFLCGHYEGIDERVLEEIVTDYVSIGDYILTGGELPAMIMVRCHIQTCARRSA